MKKAWYVYILASRKGGALYIGMSSNFSQRIWQHRENVDPNSFSSQYQIKNLVYFEEHSAFEDAALRETQLKRWKRSWKIELIENKNPNWDDLYAQTFLEEI